jgi:hypothetical protein
VTHDVNAARQNMTNAPRQVSLRKSTLSLLLLGGGLIVLALILSGASLVRTLDMTGVNPSSFFR